MNYYGYDRTSTTNQHLDRGIHEIEEFCKKEGITLQKMYTDQITGKTFNRPRYTVLKEDILRPGDCLIITETDRFGRNKKEILKEMQYFRDHSIRIMILEIPTTLQDLSSLKSDLASMILETINNTLIEVFAALAEAEMHKREKRQKEGIEQMKARGEWYKYGRPRVMSPDEFAGHYSRVINGELSGYALMKELNMSCGTFYRYKKELLEK